MINMPETCLKPEMEHRILEWIRSQKGAHSCAPASDMSC